MNTNQKDVTFSILERLFEPVIDTPKSELGHYDKSSQTWSHRDSKLMSPVKHNKEN